MTDVEIFERLNLIRDVVIQSHVQMNHAMDMIERLIDDVRRDIAPQEVKKP